MSGYEILQLIVFMALVAAVLYQVAVWDFHKRYPDYYELMPDPKSGRFVVGVTCKTGYGYKEFESTAMVNCRRKAYKAVRASVYILERTLLKYPTTAWYVRELREGECLA